MSRGVVLLSGGLDSAVTLRIAAGECREIYALTVRYGQRHAVEIECASRLAKVSKVAGHRVIDVDLASWGGSSLTGDGPVAKEGGRADQEVDEIPQTYVPARNTVLLSLALAWAEVLGAESIYIGVHVQDAGGYPDTRADYLEAFETMARLATRVGVEGKGPSIRAPLLEMTKAEIVQLGFSLGVDFSMTSSCYDPLPSGSPCGSCDACRLRAGGFEETGRCDPRKARES